MIETKTYHVYRCAGSDWQVLKEGFHRPHFVRPNREEAVTLAKRLAKLGGPGRVIVHGSNGQVEGQFAYLWREEAARVAA